MAKVEQVAVQRIVEEHAARRGDACAIASGQDVLSYRDLNARANAVARHLLDAGFRRGDRATINMPPGGDLATVLLAVLKSGGAYTWLGATSRVPWTCAIARPHGGDEQRHQAVDLSAILRAPVRPGPNLPILTRPSDVACVLVEEGDPPLLVPHATIAALPAPTTAPVWEGDRTTFDLWAGLIAGMALSVEMPPLMLKVA